MPELTSENTEEGHNPILGECQQVLAIRLCVRYGTPGRQNATFRSEVFTSRRNAFT